MYSVEKTKGTNYIKQFDYYLFFAVLVLSCIGLVALWSATRTMQYSGNMVVYKQIIGVILGIFLAIIASTVDYKDYKVLGTIFYLLCAVLLGVVIFIGTGKDEWGSNSWLDLKIITFQPSEPAKITFIIVAAIFLERINDDVQKSKNIVKLLIYSAVPIGLILLQPDAGTAMVFMFIFAVMVFIGGLPFKYIFPAIGAMLVSSPFIWMYLLKDHQKKRFLVFFNPEMDLSDAGYQVARSKIAIGSGQLYGKGLFEGIQTQTPNGIPVKESDFIFAVIGEELGFIGAVFVIALILFILLRCIYIARASRDAYGAYLVAGMTAMFAFHSIENIGMCVGVLPVTGIPLPFVSQGVSAVVTNYIALGIILSVSMRRKKAIFSASD